MGGSGAGTAARLDVQRGRLWAAAMRLNGLLMSPEKRRVSPHLVGGFFRIDDVAVGRWRCLLAIWPAKTPQPYFFFLVLFLSLFCSYYKQKMMTSFLNRPDTVSIPHVPFPSYFCAAVLSESSLFRTETSESRQAYPAGGRIGYVSSILKPELNRSRRTHVKRQAVVVVVFFCCHLGPK